MQQEVHVYCTFAKSKYANDIKIIQFSWLCRPSLFLTYMGYPLSTPIKQRTVLISLIIRVQQAKLILCSHYSLCIYYLFSYLLSLVTR